MLFLVVPEFTRPRPKFIFPTAPASVSLLLFYPGFIIAHVIVCDGLIYRFTDILPTGLFGDRIAQVFALPAGMGIVRFGRAMLRLPVAAPRLNVLTLIAIVLLPNHPFRRS